MIALTEKAIEALAALRWVFDPEIGLNVVDMGLIYELSVEEDAKKILVLMTLSTQYCPMGQSIVDSVKNRLELSYPGYEIEITVTFEPTWSMEMISAEGQEFLNR
ncbi:metal-sulfur cluster assembly factor [Chitinophaga silvisoli]|uniref:Metal-sulfur cluster assembly factor n=1 Tax=Chitinophaga silvisoli TaxID=2291814 RepID=A0A3E1NVF9_9BACT|nr:metal-sulfur cluster assembly factor [Chitinophaga silvisoli]RFM31834.1 metal-sulfur cluster assembly factor [Chitinophaga silvisoli]